MPDEKDKDLSQDETQNVDEQEVEQSTTEDTEQTQDDQTEETTDDTQETEGEDEVEKPKSHRENLRIQELVKKLREQSQPQTETPKGEHLDYKTELNADDDVIKRLEDDRTAARTSSFNEGIRRAEAIQFRTLLEIDAPRISSKYPQFDQDSPDFNPTLAATLNDWYLGTVGFDQKTGFVNNSNIRYKDFVEGVMEIAEVMADKKSSTTATNLAKQAANTALRPGGNTAKKLDLNKAPQDMTDEELDAVIGSVIPTKKR